MDESFYIDVAPIWADSIENGLITLDDVPDALRPYVEAEIARRKKEEA